NWENPKWAGIAVAMVSLSTVGQSFNKATMRMLGTFLGISVALIIIALAPQERYLFIFILAPYIGFCVYMMSGRSRNYFWHVSGFVCVVICFSAGPDSANAFNIAMVRAQETGLGILVYSLIALLIWPNSSRSKFHTVLQKLSSTQHQLLNLYFQLLSDSSKAKAAQTLQLQTLQIRTEFAALLDAAETDSHEIREMRQQWRLYQTKTTELAEAMERLRNNFSSIQDLDVCQIFQNLDAFHDGIDERLKQIEKMLLAKQVDYYPTTITLQLDLDKLSTLLNFQKPAITLIHSQFQRLDSITLELFNIVKEIQERKLANKQITTVDHSNSVPVLDVDRFAYVIRILTIMFLSFLAVIYINDIPGKFTIVTIATVFGMVISTMPQVSVWKLLTPALLAISFAGFIYIFLMPQISSFMLLGPLIFSATFVIGYLFSAPKQALGRVIGLAMFIMVTGISNQQSYSFLAVANTALMYPIAFMIISISAYFPISWNPNHVFKKMHKRYFHSCAYVIASIFDNSQIKRTLKVRYKLSFHTKEIATLPHKLNSWVKSIDTKGVSVISSDQVQALVNCQEALTLCIQDLQKIYKNTEHLYLTEEMQNAMHMWSRQISDCLEKISKQSDSEIREILGSRVGGITEKFEQHIRTLMDKGDASQFSKEDGENFYILLGAYRSVSERVIEYTGKYERINWTQWYEPRFT
ncbi:MAG: putative membrane protein YccC, partial [Enterobacterales bacterium]